MSGTNLASVIHEILFYGVIASLALLAIGTVTGVANEPLAQLSTLPQSTPSMLSAFWAPASLGQFACLVAGAGALILIAIPLARAAVTALRFAADKDRMYAYVTCGVLVVLVLGFLVPFLMRT